MEYECREVRPSQKPRHVIDGGALREVPLGWELLPPGDAALSRRIKQDGPTWLMIELKGNKRFSRGIWAPGDRIEALRAELAAERTDPAYERRLASGRARRAAEHEVYVAEFEVAVRAFLDFPARHAEVAGELARRITAHATPVGSGTVARTERIPLPDRARATTIAWLRHQTTGYDDMRIARIKGERREVRRELARESLELLDRYRRGEEIEPETCPLQVAIRGGAAAGS